MFFIGQTKAGLSPQVALDEHARAPDARAQACWWYTWNPDEQWVIQQARNARMWLDDLGVQPRFLIHERDTKLTKQFRVFWKDQEDARCIRTPLKAPKTNAYSERHSVYAPKPQVEDIARKENESPRRAVAGKVRETATSGVSEQSGESTVQVLEGAKDPPSRFRVCSPRGRS
jgi:hypothetical protein